jgi:type II secretory pathway pseudopilin PulG
MAISSEINSTQTTQRRPIEHGRSFLIESLIVLGFLMASLAVFAQIFSGAQIEAVRARQLSQAVQLATNCAERFSADPTSVPAKYEEGGLVVTCVVEPTPNGDAGTLYEASITVRDATGATEEEVYALHTSRYVQGPADSTTGGKTA